MSRRRYFEEQRSGGGYGGGAGGAGNTWQSGYQSPGGDGTVLIRGKRYKL